MGATQIEDEDKREQYIKFADVFLKSCMETWLKTSTGIAPESWVWTPEDDSLQEKLNQLLDKDLKIAKVASQKTKSNEAIAKSFTIDNAMYDLRPGIASLFC